MALPPALQSGPNPLMWTSCAEPPGKAASDGGLAPLEPFVCRRPCGTRASRDQLPHSHVTSWPRAPGRTPRPAPSGAKPREVTPVRRVKATEAAAAQGSAAGGDRCKIRNRNVSGSNGSKDGDAAPSQAAAAPAAPRAAGAAGAVTLGAASQGAAALGAADEPGHDDPWAFDEGSRPWSHSQRPSAQGCLQTQVCPWSHCRLAPSRGGPGHGFPMSGAGAA